MTDGPARSTGGAATTAPAYVARMFAARFLVLLGLFAVLLLVLDLLNISSDLRAAPGADWRSLARYAALKAPSLIVQFAPFAALLGVVVTLAAMKQRSEITVMRASGLSIQRILFPLGLACAVVAVGHFAFQELAAIPSSARLAAWKAAGFPADGSTRADGADTRTDVRLRIGDSVLEAESARRGAGTDMGADTGAGAGAELETVSILALTPDGVVRSVVEAASARYEDGAWRLIDARVFDPQTRREERFATLDGGADPTPAVVFALTVDPSRTALRPLVAEIRAARTEGRNPARARTALWSRFSQPAASLVMPLLGAIAGFGVARQGALLARAAMGAALGFSYFVVENLLLAFGKLGAVEPAFAAFFPLAFFGAVGLSVVLAMET